MITASAGDSASSDGNGRRRFLTLLFSDLSDSTFLSGILEAEHYAQMLSDLRQCFRDIVPKHGGQIARIQGDGVLAIFGFPQAREDDGRRATETALELHAAAGRIMLEGHYPNIGPLMLHSGVHGGLVFVAEGDVERGRFELLGTVPNMASRLSGLALRGEICVSDETLGADTHFFATTGPHVVAFDGSPTKMRMYRVLGQAPVQSRLQARAMRGLAPFVGRAGEIEALDDSFRALLAGSSHRRCIAISGGPGLGKTRLIEEFLRDKPSSSPCLVLRGYCESYLTAEPLQPFLQMLRALFRLEPGMSIEEAEAAARTAWAKACPDAGDEAGQPLDAMAMVGACIDARPQTAGGALTTLRALFDVLAACRPLLIVLDDWQWADDASQETLAALRTLQRPLLVVVAHRAGKSDPIDLGVGETLQLEPLELVEASDAMAKLLPGADPFMVAEIHRYAGGNPLFIEELCHAASAEAGSKQLERRLGGAWLNALIESRVGRLPEEQAGVVRAAAVMGNAFPVWLFESITGYSASDPLVSALAEQDFLFPGEQAGTMRFKHGIARDVVYDTIGLHQRKRVHLRVAAAIDSAAGERGAEDYCEALAYHFAAGGLHAEAARYAELAGDKAMLAPALDRARTQYGAALEALDALPLTRERQLRWCGLAQKIGMVCVYDPLALTDGVELLSRSVELARQSGDTETIARSEYWLGYTCYARGRTRDAIKHLEEALKVSSGTADARLVAQIEATLGQALAAACDYDRALVLLDGAVATKRRQSRPGSHVAVGSAYTLSCKGAVLGDRGEFALAHECFAEALSLLGESPHQVGCSVRGWISTVFQWQGRWQEALDASQQAARMAELMRSRHLLAMSRALSGFSTWMLTGEPAAMEEIRTATSWIEARDGAFFTSLNYGWLVHGSSQLEFDEQARRHAARMFRRARLGDQVGEALGCRALARRAAKGGHFDQAERYLERAFASADRRCSPHERASSMLCRAEVEAMRGPAGRARAPLDEACEAFEAMGMHWHAKQAQIVRASL